MKIIHVGVGLWQQANSLSQERSPRRDERGLSQSTENAVLLAGAAVIALLIITVITDYVRDNLPG